MSQENVDLVRGSIGAFNSGDWDESLEYMDEGIEWRAPFVVLDQDTYVGRDGVRTFWTAWTDNFEGFRLEVEDLIDAGDDVVVVARISGEGIASGAGVRSNPFAHVVRLRNGKIRRWEMYESAQEALEAVGLRD
jgi:ketosteroid isomerase-like protein